MYLILSSTTYYLNVIVTLQVQNVEAKFNQLQEKIRASGLFHCQPQPADFLDNNSVSRQFSGKQKCVHQSFKSFNLKFIAVLKIPSSGCPNSMAQ